MIYVAGVAEQTPTDIVVDEKAPEGRRVTVMATRQGDGRVPWETGIPAELTNQTYYMNAVHGDLANTEDAFPAIVDLLSNGTTSKLSQTPPAVRGDAKETFPLREATVDAFPDDASIAAAAVGGRRGRKPRRAQEPVRVSVVHDNLIWAHLSRRGRTLSRRCLRGRGGCSRLAAQGTIARAAAARSLSRRVQHVGGRAQRAARADTERRRGTRGPSWPVWARSAN